MTNLQQPPEFNTPESGTTQLSKKRRRFIKGSAAVLPVVLTLRNGSAFAVVSISCLEKQKALLPATIITTKNADTFVRDETIVRTITNITISSDVLRIYEYPLSSGKWFRDTVNSTSEDYFVMSQADNNCDNDTNTIIPASNLMEQVNNPCPQYRVTGSDTPGWILAQLDANTRLRIMNLDDNNPVVGPKENNQSAMIVATASCAASLHS